MKISKYISYNDAIKSTTAIRLGISNIPNANQVEAMKSLCENIVDKVIEEFGVDKVLFNSFFRSMILNEKIGGASTSQHTKGEAIDLDSNNNELNAKIFNFILDYLDFDQLIWEFGNDEKPDWVHVSFKANGQNRKQVLKAYKQRGATKYMEYKRK